MPKDLPSFHLPKRQEKQLHSAFLDLKNEEKGADTELFNQELLTQLLNSKANKKFIKLTGGYSNQTYKIDDLVLRFPKLINPLIRNLSIEVHNLRIAYGLKFSPLEIRAYYFKHNLLVTRFIPQYRPFTQEDFKDPKKVIIVAELIKKIHYSKEKFKKNAETPLAVVNTSSKSFEKIKTILNKEDHAILSKINVIMTILEKFNTPERPSHGDLHHGNLIELNNKIQLIDWEFSSMEDPAYDIARLFCVSDLSKENIVIFLDSYQYAEKIILSTKTIEELKQRIQLFMPINFFSILLWAKFEIQFRKGNKKMLLEKTVSSFYEKTLHTLAKLDVGQIKDKKNTLANPTLFFNSLKFLPISSNTIPDEVRLNAHEH